MTWKWTKADEERAAKEGWRVQGGVLYRTFNPDGSANFTGLYSLTIFLLQQSKRSKWHKEAYLQTAWTAADDFMSVKDGWKLGAAGSIYRCRHNSISRQEFSSDEEAKEHIVREAEKGSALHIKALRTATKRRLLAPQ